MGDLPDPKMELLIVPYKTLFCGDIPWNLALKNRPYIREVPPIKVPEMAFDLKPWTKWQCRAAASHLELAQNAATPNPSSH